MVLYIYTNKVIDANSMGWPVHMYWQSYTRRLYEWRGYVTAAVSAVSEANRRTQRPSWSTQETMRWSVFMTAGTMNPGEDDPENTNI